MNTIEKALKKKSQQQNQHVDGAAELLDKLADQKIVDSNPEDSLQYDSMHFDSELQSGRKERASFQTEISSAETITHDAENTIDNEIPSSKANGIEDNQKLEKESTNKNSREVNIDLKNMQNMGFLVPHGSNSVLNEEYRQIKRPLINNIRGKSAYPIERANLIQVTSSLQGEGKTFTSINLAIAVAMEMDLNVLLVDADVIKSSVTRILINRNEKGLTDYLSGDVKELSDVLLATNIPKLKLLPAGTRNQLSTELLNSHYMEQLISEFSQRYDNRVVIIDSPPMLQTNEARILAHKVGQIVFVVEQNKTPQDAVKNALALIDREMVVGLVMNKSRTGKQGGYYGYYGPSE